MNTTKLEKKKLPVELAQIQYITNHADGHGENNNWWFSRKKVVTKIILQFAQKISIIKKTIAHKVYKILLIATLIPDFGSIGEI